MNSFLNPTHPLAAVSTSASGPTCSEIVGFGSALPKLCISNQQFEEILDTSDEWITQRTGIRNRRFCDSGESSATLGIEASRRALSMAGVGASEVDLIICATVTPQSVTPSNATRIQDALGCRPIPAFDVSAACSGFLFALSTANLFLKTGQCKTALVVGAEALSRCLDFTDRNSCILFGDAAGAIILRASEGGTKTQVGDEVESHRSGPVLLECQIQSQPDTNELIRVPANSVESANSLATESNFLKSNRFDYIGIDGREVFRFAIETMCQCIARCAAANSITPAEIDLIVPHQVNTRVFEAVAEKLKIDRCKIFSNISEYGNTSAASVPVALDEVARKGLAKPGDHVCLVAFGGGVTSGSAMLKW